MTLKRLGCPPDVAIDLVMPEHVLAARPQWPHVGQAVDVSVLPASSGGGCNGDCNGLSLDSRYTIVVQYADGYQESSLLTACRDGAKPVSCVQWNDWIPLTGKLK